VTREKVAMGKTDPRTGQPTDSESERKSVGAAQDRYMDCEGGALRIKLVSAGFGRYTKGMPLDAPARLWEVP